MCAVYIYHGSRNCMAGKASTGLLTQNFCLKCFECWYETKWRPKQWTNDYNFVIFKPLWSLLVAKFIIQEKYKFQVFMVTVYPPLWNNQQFAANLWIGKGWKFSIDGMILAIYGGVWAIDSWLQGEGITMSSSWVTTHPGWVTKHPEWVTRASWMPPRDPCLVNASSRPLPLECHLETFPSWMPPRDPRECQCHRARVGHVNPMEKPLTVTVVSWAEKGVNKWMETWEKREFDRNERREV